MSQIIICNASVASFSPQNKQMYAAVFSTGDVVIHQSVTLKLSCPGLKEELERFNWGGRSSNKATCNMDLASCKYLSL